MLAVESLETIVARILTDYENLSDYNGQSIDISRGSVAFIDAHVLACAIQGIQYRQNASLGYALPNLDNSPRSAILMWASGLGIQVLQGDTDADIIAKIYGKLQNPPAGGNEHDWIMWSYEISVTHKDYSGNDFVEKVRKAFPKENGTRPGGNDFVAVSDVWDNSGKLSPGFNGNVPLNTYPDGTLVSFSSNGISQIAEVSNINNGSGFTTLKVIDGATSKLVEALKRHIDKKRPLGIWNNLFYAAKFVRINIRVEVDYVTDKTGAQQALIALIDNKAIGESIYEMEIKTVLWDYGAKRSVLTSVPGETYLSGDKHIEFYQVLGKGKEISVIIL